MIGMIQSMLCSNMITNSIYKPSEKVSGIEAMERCFIEDSLLCFGLNIINVQCEYNSF